MAHGETEKSSLLDGLVQSAPQFSKTAPETSCLLVADCCLVPWAEGGHAVPNDYIDMPVGTEKPCCAYLFVGMSFDNNKI